MSIIDKLFGPPNVEKMRDKKNAKGLIEIAYCLSSEKVRV